MRKVKILITREDGTEDLPLPHYQTSGSSGMDLYCAEREPVVLKPGDIRMIRTGIAVSIPVGYEAQIRPRSGLACKHGITLANSPGTVDSDYRGVVTLIVINLGRNDFTVTRGLRLAQMVIQPVARAEWSVVPALDVTARSVHGFGHTGDGAAHARQ